MSNLTTKRCSQCKQEKPISAFHKNKRARDGYQNCCIDCKRELDAKYRTTEHGKTVRRVSSQRYRQSPDGAEAIRKYQQSEHGKAVSRKSSRKYAQTESGKRYINEFRQSEHGRELARQWESDQRQKHPLEVDARNAVRQALRRGMLPHPITLNCDICGKSAAEYHHNSYESEDWLRVIPLCSDCHHEVHRQYTDE